MAIYRIDTKDIRKAQEYLRAGDEVYISGTVYTARDAAHKRFMELMKSGECLPFDLKDAVIYYSGPTPEREGYVIGSCGPTTSSRMDKYTPYLLENGLCGIIGKGPRSKEVNDALVKYNGIYFCAYGGLGAIAAKSVKSLEVIAFEELGCESVKKLYLEEFPTVCAVDSHGGNMFNK